MQPQFNASDIDNGVGFSLYCRYLMTTTGFWETMTVLRNKRDY